MNTHWHTQPHTHFLSRANTFRSTAALPFFMIAAVVARFLKKKFRTRRQPFLSLPFSIACPVERQVSTTFVLWGTRRAADCCTGIDTALFFFLQDLPRVTPPPSSIVVLSICFSKPLWFYARTPLQWFHHHCGVLFYFLSFFVFLYIRSFNLMVSVLSAPTDTVNGPTPRKADCWLVFSLFFAVVVVFC